MEEVLREEAAWRCWKHPSRRLSGVCPACLRDRLLRLCPDCASVLPCGCCASSASSSSSSSFSSLSSADPFRSGGSGAGIGAVGRVSHLIDREPAFRRSRSVASQYPRPGLVAGEAAQPQGARSWASLWFWRFSREAVTEAKLSRSRSVLVTSYTDPGGKEARAKGWKWYFPSPMNAFRHRKTATVVQERSPLYRA